MDRAPKRNLADAGAKSMPGPEPHDDRAEETDRRQQAAACLRAARLTDDADEREALRRKAGALLSPRPRRRGY